MAIHKLALIRYKTIDACLRNRYRKWTLDDLIAKVSEAIYDTEGIENGISRRTIQSDIQLMRSDKLGYSAPIVVVNKKYYTYSDPTYSINNSRLTEADIEKMGEVLRVLEQMSGFTYFEEMSDILTRLDNSIRKSVSASQSNIQLESNHLLKGIHHLRPLYQAILKKVPLLITYQSFKASEARNQVYYPYLLKEYRNRWFLICRPKQNSHLQTLALDRIVEFMEMAPKDFVPYEGVSFDRYFEDTIGVTKTEKDRGIKVILWFDKKNSPYVLTKPLHASQKLLKEDDNGIIVRLDVVLNFELEREILGFGESVKVLGPRLLKSRIQKRIEKALENYSTISRQ